MSNITNTALRRAMQVLREVLEQSNGGSGGGDGDKHTAWPDGSMSAQNWDKMSVLDVYLSQVCVKHEPSTKTGAQMWFVGAGTFRKYTLTNGQITTVYTDLESLIGKKADPPTRFDSPFDVEKYNKAKLGDYYLGQVCVRDGSDGKHFVGPGTYRKYTLSADGKTVNTEYVDLNSTKVDKPKAWTSGPFTGIKAGDTVSDQTVVFVHGGNFFVWNGKGVTSCPVTASNIASYDGFFFARDWSDSELKANPVENLLQVAVGDRIGGLPVVRISQNGAGAIKTRVEVSNGTEGFYYYELDNSMALYKAKLTWAQSIFTSISVSI